MDWVEFGESFLTSLISRRVAAEAEAEYSEATATALRRARSRRERSRAKAMRSSLLLEMR